MKLDGVEIPEDINVPELSAETIAEIDALHASLHRHYEEIEEDGSRTALTESPEPSKPVTVSINTLRKLEPLARAKVLYMLRAQVTV
ncbi:hypothetical protein GJ697_09670 [Pseudoduganella sp. FT25W]|uniref:Uncharacterized protein n=1 Tax=Duganella alba TaxID=2666081 RepID=A0A6L5QEL6_9BURK|nr:hypothetical protein [Duganella alba]MRX08099.1 hypothetical protein [Duganella alba]MRX16364.1 hypothetical protein [Duganella alba]